MVRINLKRLTNRVVRARSAVGADITYYLGAGGFDPNASLPSSSNHQCDCSGFLAWVFGLSRRPKPSRPWWWETTDLVEDATNKQTTVVRLDKPVAGCGVVYGDGHGHQGHCGIITDVAFDHAGHVTKLTGIDCSLGSSKATGQAIREHDLTFFLAQNCVFFILREDLL